MQDLGDLLGIDRDRDGIFLRAIDYAGNISRHAYATRFILAARFRSSRLCFYCLVGNHCLLLPLRNLVYKNKLLTDVSSWIDWMALATSPAIDKTLIFGSCFEASLAGM